jgi:hypothetical protein
MQVPASLLFLWGGAKGEPSIHRLTKGGLWTRHHPGPSLERAGLGAALGEQLLASSSWRTRLSDYNIQKLKGATSLEEARNLFVENCGSDPTLFWWP